MIWGVPFLALVLHARDLDCFTVGNPVCEMLTRAVDAKLMAALEREEIFRLVVFVARVACFTVSNGLGTDSI